MISIRLVNLERCPFEEEGNAGGDPSSGEPDD
jgi:hypothetical protein